MNITILMKSYLRWAVFSFADGWEVISVLIWYKQMRFRIGICRSWARVVCYISCTIQQAQRNYPFWVPITKLITRSNYAHDFSGSGDSFDPKSPFTNGISFGRIHCMRSENSFKCSRKRHRSYSHIKWRLSLINDINHEIFVDIALPYLTKVQAEIRNGLFLIASFLCVMQKIWVETVFRNLAIIRDLW